MQAGFETKKVFQDCRTSTGLDWLIVYIFASNALFLNLGATGFAASGEPARYLREMLLQVRALPSSQPLSHPVGPNLFLGLLCLQVY